MPTQIPTEEQYRQREREIYERDLLQAERGTAKEKREAQAAWVDDLTNDADLIAERVSWLLAGHYGKGAYDAAWGAVNSIYIKPTSILLEIVAALEWSVPRGYFLTADRKVPTESLARVHAAVERVVDSAKKEER
jgi:hypothetical protein